jgi:hypothetical protein
MDIPESDAEAAPPHAWSKLRLGSADEFSRIAHDTTDWDGDYLDLSDGTPLSLLTDQIAVSFTFSVFHDGTLTADPFKVFLWNDYQTDQLTIEIVGWKPAYVAIVASVTDGNSLPEIKETVRRSAIEYETHTVEGLLSVTLGSAIAPSTPLLRAQGFTWKAGWQVELT